MVFLFRKILTETQFMIGYHGHSELIKSSLASFGKNFGKIFLVSIYLFFFLLFQG